LPERVPERPVKAPDDELLPPKRRDYVYNPGRNAQGMTRWGIALVLALLVIFGVIAWLILRTT